MANLTQSFPLKTEKVVEDLLAYVPAYKDLAGRDKKIKSDFLDAKSRDLQKFVKRKLGCKQGPDELIAEGLVTEELAPKNLKKNAKLPADSSLHYPQLLWYLNLS